jgi:amphi-Trp domain-containing protein
MEFEKELSKPQAAALLRQLADALDSDAAATIQVDDLTIEVPPQLDISLEYETDEDQAELEIEMNWSTTPKKQRSGKFELFQGANEQWYFRLKAPNGEVILASEGYASKQGALNGIEAVRNNAQAEQIEYRESKAGQPYFVLKAKNNEIIGMSQMYKRHASCHKGAQSVIKHAPDAEADVSQA